ncbi:hypothetical protein D9M70_480640 [compost metagenome]
MDLHPVSTAHPCELRFAQVGLDPQIPRWRYGHQPGARRDVLSQSDISCRHQAFAGRFDVGPRKVVEGALKTGFGRFQLSVDDFVLSVENLKLLVCEVDL